MSDNPLLAPIQGVSLEDYSAACAKLANGLSEAEIATALGVTLPVWQEANLEWQERMATDTSFEIVTLFGQYFGTADQHPKFSNLNVSVSEEGAANIERIKSDKDFYQELEVARQVAYAHGRDGAQWILDVYGIPLGDFQVAASMWTPQILKEIDADPDAYRVGQDAYRNKYEAHFAE